VSGPSANWRVLVVEPHSDDAESLVRGLRRHGHEVVSVATGGAALQVYEDSDLVLLDLDLPDLDGLEVCRSIRSVCDVAVIAVTGPGRSRPRPGWCRPDRCGSTRVPARCG
jgi:CheY-like chemotaxis protein